MRIVLDAMGGDYAPKVNVDGAIDALREYKDVEIILVGPQGLLEETIGQYADQQAYEGVKERLSIVNATEVITTEEHPAMALRRKKDSTFNVGMDIVRRKNAEAFVSAGSTGAVMLGSMLRIGRIKGVERPALGAMVPVPGRPLLIVDAGANTDCKPMWINQFAMMGSIYMERVQGVEKPEVGLLNIGVEAAKGNEQSQQAYALMNAQSTYNFIGNVESREAVACSCDVLAADGFVSNILIKNIEGTVATIFKLLKEGLLSSTKGKIAALMAKDTFKQLKGCFDPTEVGGAPLLGVEGVVVKAHGNSNARAIFCAIRQAKKAVDADVVEEIRAGVAKLAAAQVDAAQETAE